MSIGPFSESVLRAVAAGCVAVEDLRRTSLRGGTTENEGMLARRALEAVDKMEGQGGVKP